MMRWRQIALVCLAVVAMTGIARSAGAQDTVAADGGKLKVVVEYKGQSGTVDREHRIWVWLFDNPNITADSIPLATGVLSENKGAYKFIGLPKQVYLAAAYDSTGGYDGTAAPPPQGTPVVIHGVTDPGTTATPIATGDDDATVTVTFDDTVRMP
jgi:hypothetical protein